MSAVDVDANVGYFTLLMAKIVGSEGQVLPVEADPDAVAFLRADLALRIAIIEVMTGRGASA